MFGGNSYKIEEAKWITTYSSVPNRRACMCFNFEKKYFPAWPYFGLHVYWFGEKILPARVLILVLHIY